MKIPDDFAAKLLDSLRPREREVLGLRYLQQFTDDDIAHLLRVNVGSVYGHAAKGLAKVAAIVADSVDRARWLLDTIGEMRAKQRPKEFLTLAKGLKVAVFPHRELMGAAVRADEHLFTDALRYFMAGPVIDGEKWALKSPVALGSAVIRELLHLKDIKNREKFDREISSYFFAAGFGCAELYYEHDLNHQPQYPPLFTDRFPPVPVDPARRTELLPDTWPFRVVDLGEYARKYDDAMAEDAERALRSQ